MLVGGPEQQSYASSAHLSKSSFPFYLLFTLSVLFPAFYQFTLGFQIYFCTAFFFSKVISPMATDWIMEPAAAAWVPCNLQLANWTTDPAVCSTGLPADIFGDCLQTSVPVSKGEPLVEYAVARDYDPVETSEQEFVVDIHNVEKAVPNPILVFKDLADQYKMDVEMMGKKIHRYPASIQALCLSDRYAIPMVVSIGPYHHHRGHLKQAEKVKHVAAYNCIRTSGYTIQEMYDVVVPVAHRCRRLYDDDALKLSDDDFLPMMFFDACFLVQYMLAMSETNVSKDMDDSMCSFFDSNDNEIFHDIMLLENQLPWPVVKAVIEFVYRDVKPDPLKAFMDSCKGCLQDRKYQQVENSSVVNYEPPHLLGLLRFYIAGENKTVASTKSESRSISFSVSAVELAEIGVTLKPSERTELIHMGLKTEGTLFAELSLAPLSLDSSRASLLINMAALELCTTPNFSAAEDEKSAVCSYLLFLAMLVDREEDVQELRTKRLLQGGGGLNDREALDFFTSIQSLRLGSRYVCIMRDIENYREKRRTRANVHAFFYRNIKIIAAVVSAIVTIVSILGTLLSIKS